MSEHLNAMELALKHSVDEGRANDARVSLLALAASIRKHGLPARALKEVSSWTRQVGHIADAIEAIATEQSDG